MAPSWRHTCTENCDVAASARRTNVVLKLFSSPACPAFHVMYPMTCELTCRPSMSAVPTLRDRPRQPTYGVV
jgi:hypothetical protein